MLSLVNMVSMMSVIMLNAIILCAVGLGKSTFCQKIEYKLFNCNYNGLKFFFFDFIMGNVLYDRPQERRSSHETQTLFGPIFQLQVCSTTQ
jgi:hypothetical protein